LKVDIEDRAEDLRLYRLVVSFIKFKDVA
jgi:hypothetical protein